MNKHDHEHFFRELHRHIVEANAHSTQPQVLHHIEHAKNIVVIIADDLGIDVIKTQGD